MYSKPIITPQIGGYLFSWEAESLLVRVSHLRVHTSDGRVTGELQITNNNQDKSMILLPSTQFNFSSDMIRARQAKQLREKYSDSKIEWVELFDFLAHTVQELARGGDVSQEVWAEDDIRDVEYLLKPLIIKGMSNIIFGEKGVNKSTTAYLAGAIVYLPWLENPLEFEVCDQAIKTLVLDYETDLATFNYYLARLKKGTNIPAFSLNYRHCILPLADDIEAIEKEIIKTGASLLIIDSLAAAAGGEDAELKGSQSALRFNSAIRKLNTTSLIIAQTSKGQAEKSRHKTIYGSTIFTYYARNIFELCHSEEIDSNTKHLALFHRECNLARKSAPMGIRLDFNEDRSISINRESVSISEFTDKMTTQARILDVLKRGAMEIKELAQSLDITEPNCRMAVSRLTKKGKLIKVSTGYGLLTHP
uniref:Putative ATPase domain containing protein n=1 Tax=viral metagenome TaxID=1070528 RepID=A0A6H1ZQJ1_9ZZZZ